jgi:hypothetical protein
MPTVEPSLLAESPAGKDRDAAPAKDHDAADAAAAKLIAIPKLPATPNDAAAAVTAAPDAASPPRERAKPGTDARDLVKRLVAEAVPPSSIEQAAAAAAERPRSDGASGGDSAPRVQVGAPITVAETPVATVQVADTFTVVTSPDTARVTASPTVTIREAPSVDGLVAKPVAPPADALVARPAAAVPSATEDEPSDGIVRAPVATIDTAKMRARDRRPTPAPEHDGPPQKEATGEIRHRPAAQVATHAEQPSIVVEQLVDRQPTLADQTAFVEKHSLDQTPAGAAQVEPPSILVADLAAVHAAAAAATAPAAAPGSAATPARELVVAEARRDAALALTDAEEAFFNKAETGPVRLTKVESFDDLDEGYEPPKFWDRVFGKKKEPPKR